MSIRKYLPHKKFVIILLSIILIAGVFYFLHKKSQNTTVKIKNTETQLTPEQRAIFQDVVNRDTDADGIADWEEALWGTDVLAKDTDGDGISDYAFIQEKKKALNETNGIDENDTKENNETDLFAQELFATIISLKESGNLNQQSLEDISKKIAEGVGERKDLSDKYDITELKIDPNPTKASRQIYNDAIEKLVKKYNDRGLDHEITILAEALKEESAEKLIELEPISQAYIAFASEFIKIKVPNDIADTHLTVANTFYKTGIAVKNMSMLFENELIGLIGISQNRSYNEEAGAEFAEIGEYLKRNGII